MNRNHWIFALTILLVASLACTGGAAPTIAPVEAASTVVPAPAANGSSDYETEFPLPEDVYNFSDLGNGGINFQTKMNLEDAIAFYREAFSQAGYKEREINTAITDTTFSMVFDGHASGKAIVTQGVDLGDGSTNVNIRFEDL